jgi:hypothetical protein
LIEVSLVNLMTRSLVTIHNGRSARAQVKVKTVAQAIFGRQ